MGIATPPTGVTRGLARLAWLLSALAVAALLAVAVACDDGGGDGDADADGDTDGDGDGDGDADEDDGGGDADVEPGCPTGELRCDGTCVPCPEDHVRDVGCDGAECVAVLCDDLYRPCDEGCCEWTLEEVDPGAGEVERCTIAVDDAEDVHIAYYGFGGTIDREGRARWAIDTTGSWETEIVDESAERVGLYPSLALDSEGRPHLAYFDYTNRHLRYAVRDAGVWTAEDVDTEGSVGEHSALVLDGDDVPHIAYLDATNDAILYATLDATVWSRHEIAASAADVEDVAIAIASDGTLHVAYIADGELHYTSGSGTTWSAPESVDDARDGVSMTVDGDDAPVVAYLSLGDLILARLEGTSWTEVSVDSPGGQATDLSLALDPEGAAHISYVSQDHLSYAFERGDVWALSILERAEMGDYTGIALDGSGQPKICYVDDRAGGVLRIAR